MQNSKKPTLRAELRATTLNSDLAPHLSRLLRDARSGDIDAFAAAKSALYGAIGRALHRELSALRDADSPRAGRIKRLLNAREKEIDLDFIESAEFLAVASDIKQLLPDTSDAECIVRRDLLELAAPLFDAHRGRELDAMGDGAAPFLQGVLETQIRRRGEEIDLLAADTDYLKSMREAEHARLDALFDAVQRIDGQFVYELLERVSPAPKAWAQMQAEDYAYEPEFLRTNLEREITSRCNKITRSGYSLSTVVYEPDETGEFAFEVTLRFGEPSGMTSGYLARTFADVHPLIRDAYDVWDLLDLGEPRKRLRLSDGAGFFDHRDRFAGETRLYSWPQERVLEMLKIPARPAPSPERRNAFAVVAVDSIMSIGATPQEAADEYAATGVEVYYDGADWWGLSVSDREYQPLLMMEISPEMADYIDQHGSPGSWYTIDGVAHLHRDAA